MEAQNYNIEYLLLNESFQRYVLNKTPEDICYWEGLKNEQPQHSDTIKSAREILIFIVTRKVQPNNDLISDQVFEKLQRQIAGEMSGNQIPGSKRKLKFYWIGAATFLICVGLALFLNQMNPSKIIALTGKYLEVIVPEGQRSQLILADGTKVWLNGGTTFRYPAEFLKDKRDVFIDGEAFFSVIHLKHLPFVVHLKENLSIRVLGTEFNVKCYSTDKVIETTLIKGNIKLLREDKNKNILQEINIVPNEKASYQKDNLKLLITKLTANVSTDDNLSINKKTPDEKNNDSEMDVITAWKDDALAFHNESFQEISMKMERWFGMKIVITDDQLKREHFTGKFVNKETIYQILDIFNRSEPIRYSTKNREITISSKRKKLTIY